MGAGAFPSGKNRKLEFPAAAPATSVNAGLNKTKAFGGLAEMAGQGVSRIPNLDRAARCDGGEAFAFHCDDGEGGRTVPGKVLDALNPAA